MTKGREGIFTETRRRAYILTKDEPRKRPKNTTSAQFDFPDGIYFSNSIVLVPDASPLESFTLLKEELGVDLPEPGKQKSLPGYWATYSPTRSHKPPAGRAPHEFFIPRKPSILMESKP
jgi:hypothetical protein